MGAIEEGVVQQQYKPYADAPIALRPDFRRGKLVRGGLVVGGGGAPAVSNPVLAEGRDEALGCFAKATRGDKQSHPAHVVLVFSLSCSCCRCGLSRHAVCVCV